jgi:phosphatidylserine/phosphatidylglycerophosphate/cardiolipin synthase-like enzyme
MASLHAKLVVTNQKDALITSANLTHHDREANLELGVRLQGPVAGS